MLLEDLIKFVLVYILQVGEHSVCKRVIGLIVAIRKRKLVRDIRL